MDEKTRIDRLMSLLEASRWYKDPTFVGKDRLPLAYSLDGEARHQQVSYLTRFTEALNYWNPGARRLWDLIQEIDSGAVFGSEGRCCVCGGPHASLSALQRVGEWRWWHCQSCWDNHLNTHYRFDLCADDAIHVILAARYERSLQQAKVAPAQSSSVKSQPVQAQPSISASQSTCTVARCPAQASVLADSRLMCDMHAKQFALWQQEQNRQVEQAKVELDRPYRQRLGTGDIGSNPWNR